ncbi:hypothetical protein RAB80_014408 [Fusarium oxysporum f. sp. vasinfectum]|nr:hypothetical protein RAB80_014408 [Fusarium oxysporum f. sp. vasinfectum]KAK2926604.1 hypothetical protein FoTM2_013473 [Fusarium oxysporum f. sp. vasinfectum]
MDSERETIALTSFKKGSAQRAGVLLGLKQTLGRFELAELYFELYFVRKAENVVTVNGNRTCVIS